MQAGFLAALHLGRQLLGVQAQQSRQAPGQEGNIPHILQDHDQFIAGPVGHQHLAPVIQNHAPPGRQVLEANAVVFRTLLHLLPLQQLQEPETQEEDPEEAQDDQGGAGESPAEALLFFRGHRPPEAGFQELEAGKSRFIQTQHGRSHSSGSSTAVTVAWLPEWGKIRRPGPLMPRSLARDRLKAWLESICACSHSPKG